MKNSNEAARAVAITGGIGCGKSEVARILREAGVPVLDADDLAKDAVAPGSEGLKRVVSRFGDGVLRADGSLDRAALAGVVFRDARARADLNAIVHPQVRKAMREWAAEKKAAGVACAGVIPLLFEVGAEVEWDAVICVAADGAVSESRLRARGWNDAEIAARRAAQMPLSEKRHRADAVIENNGSLDELAARVRTVWKQILK